jgi:hypothetical protein
MPSKLNRVDREFGYLSEDILSSESNPIIVVKENDNLPDISEFNSDENIYISIEDSTSKEYFLVTSASEIGPSPIRKQFNVERSKFGSLSQTWNSINNCKIYLCRLVSISGPNFEDFPYSNTASQLISKQMQDSINELDNRMDLLSNSLGDRIEINETNIDVLDDTKADFELFYDMNEPMGLNILDSTIEFKNDSDVPSFTISPISTNFDVYVRGKKFTKTEENITIASSELEGFWFIYYDELGNLSYTNNWPEYGLYAPVAQGYWDNDNKKWTFSCDERHGIVMDWATHKYLHISNGLRWKEGLDITHNASISGDPDDENDYKVYISEGEIFNEDIYINITDTTGGGTYFEQDLNNIPVVYLEDNKLRILEDNNNLPYYRINDSSPYYNKLTTDVYNLNIVPNNKYFCTWVVATNDFLHPIIYLTGIDCYDSLVESKENEIPEFLNLINYDWFESKLLYKLIFKFKTDWKSESCPNGVKLFEVIDFRALNDTYTSISHSALSSLNFNNSGHIGFQKETYEGLSFPDFKHDDIDSNNIGVYFKRGDFWITQIDGTNSNELWVCLDNESEHADWTPVLTENSILQILARSNVDMDNITANSLNVENNVSILKNLTVNDTITTEDFVSKNGNFSNNVNIDGNISLKQNDSKFYYGEGLLGTIYSKFSEEEEPWTYIMPGWIPYDVKKLTWYANDSTGDPSPLMSIDDESTFSIYNCSLLLRQDPYNIGMSLDGTDSIIFSRDITNNINKSDVNNDLTNMKIKSRELTYDSELNENKLILKNSLPSGDGSTIGNIEFHSLNDNNENINYSSIEVTTDDVSEGNEESTIKFRSNSIQLIGQTTEPTGESGKVYFDSSTEKLKINNGSDWIDLEDGSPLGNIFYVDSNRTDDYTETGSLNRPFKTIDDALDAELYTGIIRVIILLPGEYNLSSNLIIPEKTSIIGKVRNGITITGNKSITTTDNNDNTTFKNIIFNNSSLIIKNPLVLEDCGGNVEIEIQDECFIHSCNFEKTDSGDCITFSSGDRLIIRNSIIKTTDSASNCLSITVNSDVYAYGCIFNNNSATEETIYIGSTGKILLTSCSIINTGGNPVLVQDNSGGIGPSIIDPNIIYGCNSQNGATANINDNYTKVDGWNNCTISGDTGRLLKRSGDDISFVSSTGLLSDNVQDAIDETHTTLPGGHIQNTDTGTNSTTFQLDRLNSGPLFKSNGTGEIQIRNEADTQFKNLKCNNIYADELIATLVSNGIHTLTSLSTTPSVSNGNIFQTPLVSSTYEITEFKNGTEGQIITIIGRPDINNVRIIDSGISSDSINLITTPFTPTDTKNISLLKTTWGWIEISRSNASGSVGSEIISESTIYVDSQRTDTYSEDGSLGYPYKTLQDAITNIGNFTADIRNIYLFPGVYEIEGESLSIPGDVNIIGFNNSIISAESGNKATIYIQNGTYDTIIKNIELNYCDFTINSENVKLYNTKGKDCTFDLVSGDLEIYNSKFTSDDLTLDIFNLESTDNGLNIFGCEFEINNNGSSLINANTTNGFIRISNSKINSSSASKASIYIENCSDTILEYTYIKSDSSIGLLEDLTSGSNPLRLEHCFISNGYITCVSRNIISNNTSGNIISLENNIYDTNDIKRPGIIWINSNIPDDWTEYVGNGSYGRPYKSLSDVFTDSTSSLEIENIYLIPGEYELENDIYLSKTCSIESIGGNSTIVGNYDIYTEDYTSSDNEFENKISIKSYLKNIILNINQLNITNHLNLNNCSVLNKIRIDLYGHLYASFCTFKINSNDILIKMEETCLDSSIILNDSFVGNISENDVECIYCLSHNTISLTLNNTFLLSLAPTENIIYFYGNETKINNSTLLNHSISPETINSINLTVHDSLSFITDTLLLGDIDFNNSELFVNNLMTTYDILNDDNVNYTPSTQISIGESNPFGNDAKTINDALFELTELHSNNIFVDIERNAENYTETGSINSPYKNFNNALEKCSLLDGIKSIILMSGEYNLSNEQYNIPADINIIGFGNVKINSNGSIFISDSTSGIGENEFRNLYFEDTIIQTTNPLKITNCTFNIENEEVDWIIDTDDRIEIYNSKFINILGENNIRSTLNNTDDINVFSNSLFDGNCYVGNIDTYVDGFIKLSDNINIYGDNIIHRDANMVSCLFTDSTNNESAMTVQDALDLISDSNIYDNNFNPENDHIYYVDSNRTDDYTETGNILNPYKTFNDAYINLLENYYDIDRNSDFNESSFINFMSKTFGPNDTTGDSDFIIKINPGEYYLENLHNNISDDTIVIPSNLEICGESENSVNFYPLNGNFRIQPINVYSLFLGLDIDNFGTIKFKNINFYYGQILISENIKFENCKFVNCEFIQSHSNSVFENCEFYNNIEDSMFLFMGGDIKFKNSKFDIMVFQFYEISFDYTAHENLNIEFINCDITSSIGSYQPHLMHIKGDLTFTNCKITDLETRNPDFPYIYSGGEVGTPLEGFELGEIGSLTINNLKILPDLLIPITIDSNIENVYIDNIYGFDTEYLFSYLEYFDNVTIRNAYEIKYNNSSTNLLTTINVQDAIDEIDSNLSLLLDSTGSYLFTSSNWDRWIDAKDFSGPNTDGVDPTELNLTGDYYSSWVLSYPGSMETRSVAKTVLNNVWDGSTNLYVDVYWIPGTVTTGDETVEFNLYCECIPIGSVISSNMTQVENRISEEVGSTNKLIKTTFGPFIPNGANSEDKEFIFLSLEREDGSNSPGTPYSSSINVTGILIRPEG